MSRVSVESAEIDEARREIQRLDNPKHAMEHAFDGVTGLMLAILAELREIRADMAKQDDPDA
jgi:hypothetical protein